MWEGVHHSFYAYFFTGEYFIISLKLFLLLKQMQKMDLNDFIVYYFIPYERGNYSL